MPNLTFSCCVIFDAVRPFHTVATHCPECGGRAEKVFQPSSIPQKHKWGSEAKPPREFYEANEEAIYWKHEVVKEHKEAVNNGFEG